MTCVYFQNLCVGRGTRHVMKLNFLRVLTWSCRKYQLFPLQSIESLRMRQVLQIEDEKGIALREVIESEKNKMI